MSVVVGCRFLRDGSWSATVRVDGEVLAEHAAVTGRELVCAVTERLASLADRWQRPVRAVYDLGGDPRAFAVVALVEGFDDVVCERLDPALSA